jgi:hypothetical protein
MNTRSRDTLTTLALALIFTCSAGLAYGQTTSPRNLQGPTQQELLAACQRENGAERQRCEERVRANGNPGEGSRNKSVREQQAAQPNTQNRDAKEPGSLTVPPKTAAQDRDAPRTRTDRTRMSQRSEDIKTTPRPTTDKNPVNSTDAAPTRVDSNEKQPTPSLRDPSRRTNEVGSDQEKQGQGRNTSEMPAGDRARSRPQDNRAQEKDNSATDRTP